MNIIKIKKFFIPLTFIIIIILLWQVSESASSLKMVNSGQTSLEAFIPLPTTIVKTLWSDGSIILSELLVTLARASLGFLIGFILALAFSLIVYFFPILKNLVMPISFAINSFPIIGFSPLIILLFGQGSWYGIVSVSAIISYFPIFISLEAASRKIVSQSVIELMKILNANQWQILTKVILPNSLSYFFISIKLALPASIMGAVIGEWLGANSGIGRLMILSFYQLKPGLLYAALLSVILLSLFLVYLMVLLEKKICIWKKID